MRNRLQGAGQSRQDEVFHGISLLAMGELDIYEGNYSSGLTFHCQMLLLVYMFLNNRRVAVFSNKKTR